MEDFHSKSFSKRKHQNQNEHIVIHLVKSYFLIYSNAINYLFSVNRILFSISLTNLFKESFIYDYDIDHVDWIYGRWL